ncbi:hypothetical protein PFISCL1PPCAC_21430, partial [Pristionchus fissidentatus]
GDLDGTLLDETDGVVDGISSIVVHCNTAGNAWLYKGLEIKRLECAAGLEPSCKTCDPGLIKKLMDTPSAQKFADDMFGNNGDCLTRKLICTGVNANIEINGIGGGVISDADDGAKDNIASIEVTCNADGTAWTREGREIRVLECASGGDLTVCQSCARDLISIVTMGAGTKPFNGDIIMDIDPVTKCATRTMTCKGLNAVVNVNGNEGVLNDAFDGTMDGTVTVKLHCNAAGNAWTLQGKEMRKLECAVG